MALEKIHFGNNTYFKLRISCPVCIDEGRNTPQSFWTHFGCGGSIFVGDNAFFKCNSCSENKHVKNWSFSCPEHSKGEQHRFIKPSSQGFAQAISTAGQMVSETGHKWLIEFMNNMGEF